MTSSPADSAHWICVSTVAAYPAEYAGESESQKSWSSAMRTTLAFQLAMVW